jgi:hypothetical protein
MVGWAGFRLRLSLNAVALVIRVVGRHVGVVEFSRNDG